MTCTKQNIIFFISLTVVLFLSVVFVGCAKQQHLPNGFKVICSDNYKYLANNEYIEIMTDNNGSYAKCQ